MMKSFTEFPRIREYDACAIAGIFNLDKKVIQGDKIAGMMSVMRERENGLGAGYAAYGLFPKFREYYCLQLILDDMEAKIKVEEFLKNYADIIREENVPVKKDVFREYPLVWRFFINPRDLKNPDDAIKDIMMHINCYIKGAFCLSGGKDMAVFKGNGWATEIADFYKIREVKAYMWSAHSRFPTNTPGWWGGAHPFSLLGHSVVHNGEITSYGTNANYLKEFGYECNLLTDTEVLVYLFDMIVRKSNYPANIAHRIAVTAFSPPYWEDIDRMDPLLGKWATLIRITHKQALVNGPFSIIITTDYPKPTMIGHTDRKKLRPLIAAVSEDKNTFYLGSELNAIHAVDSTMNFWQPDPGKAVIASLGEPISRGTCNPLEELKLM